MNTISQSGVAAHPNGAPGAWVVFNAVVLMTTTHCGALRRKNGHPTTTALQMLAVLLLRRMRAEFFL